MRSQLKNFGTPADPLAQEQARQDTERCEILVARLKMLRALSSAVQHLHQHAQGAASRRIALVQLLRQGLAGGMKSWQARLFPLAAAARAGGTAGQNLDASMEAHRDLQLCVKQALADCGQLRAQEKSLADSLAVLATQLDAA
jgi:hypothetical protein